MGGEGRLISRSAGVGSRSALPLEGLPLRSSSYGSNDVDCFAVTSAKVVVQVEVGQLRRKSGSPNGLAPHLAAKN